MAGSLQSSNNRGRSRRRAFRPNSDINVTPLVDVMLVLLVIFMVTAPMMTVGVNVDLPKTQAATMKDDTDPLIISVNAEGRIFLQDKEFAPYDLIPKLMQLTGNKIDTKVYVRGDEKLEYGKVMETMGMIAASGFTKVALIAEMPKMDAASPPPLQTLSQQQFNTARHPISSQMVPGQMVPGQPVYGQSMPTQGHAGQGQFPQNQATQRQGQPMSQTYAAPIPQNAPLQNNAPQGQMPQNHMEPLFSNNAAPAPQHQPMKPAGR